MKQKIIFIHGMFLTPKSWNAWVSFFEGLGYACDAPAWPFHDGEPASLRTQVPAGLGALDLATVTTTYRQWIEALPEKPVIIGHSLGGLIAQKLMAEGLAKAVVGICSVAPNRMLALDWGFLRNSASITNPFAGDEPYEMTPEGFRKNFANTMTKEASDAAFEAFAVHESRQVLRDIFDSEGEIDLSKPHAPLLLIGAEKDEIIPASLVRRNAHAYEDKRSHHESIEYSSRGHLICAQDGWEEVAMRISNWLDGHLTAERS
jgi:esterase/lipase